MENQEDIKNSIIILALDNLIKDCEYSLEENINNPENEYIQFISDSSKIILKEYSEKLNKEPKVISRPKWKKENQ